MESIETNDKTTNAKGAWPHLTFVSKHSLDRKAGFRMKKFSAASILIILCFVIDCKAEFLCSRLNSYSTPQSNCLYNVKTVFYKGTQQATFCDLRLISSFYDAGDCVRELDERGCLNRLLSGFHSNHRIIINSGILALREKKSEKGRLLPVTQNCDKGIVLIVCGGDWHQLNGLHCAL